MVFFGVYINGGIVDFMIFLYEVCFGGYFEVVDVLIVEGVDVCIILCIIEKVMF